MRDVLYSSDELRLRSCIPGRIRWYVPSILNQQERSNFVAEFLSFVAGVCRVEVNPRTGSVLVLHTSAVLSLELTAALRTALAEAGPVPSYDLPIAVAAAPKAAEPQRDGLIQVLAPHRKAAAKSLLLTLIDRLFEASPPALISLIVDSASQPENSLLASSAPSGRLKLLLTAGAAIWTADSTVGYFRSTAVNQLGSEVRRDLRNQLYNHFQTLDLAQIERELPEYWESVFNKDVNTVARYFEQGLDPLISIVANGLIVFTQLLMTSVSLALLQLAVIPALYLVSARLLPAIQKRRALSDTAETALRSRLRSNLQGFSTIASFAREQDEADRIATLGDRFTRVRETEYKLSAAYVPLLQMIVGVGFLGTLGLGSILVRRKQMYAAQLSMVGYSSLRFLTTLGHLGVGVDEYQRARTAARKIEDFRARTPQITNGTCLLPTEEVRGDFQLNRVSFSYSGEQPVFQDLSLNFPAGKTIGIVGMSGAGKSTLLKLLLRYYDVSSGAILLDGRNLRELDLHSMRRSIGYVPQQPFIFPGTVRENIAYSNPDASLEEVIAAAKLARAHDFINALPDGYDTLVRNAGIGGSAQALSGGQAQRIAIARAALTNAPVLFFDEATSAVDNETEAALHESLHQELRGRTIVLVAHRLSTVRSADLIYVLDQGRVAEAGTHQELIAKNGIYAGFWRVQTGESGHAAEVQPDNEPPSAPVPPPAEDVAVASAATEAPTTVPIAGKLDSTPMQATTSTPKQKRKAGKNTKRSRKK